jgi:hypothetical protein
VPGNGQPLQVLYPGDDAGLTALGAEMRNCIRHYVTGGAMTFDTGAIIAVVDHTGRGVSRHGEGTTWREVLPRGWDQLVASDGTTCVVAGRLTALLRVCRVDAGRVSYREVTVIEIKEVLRLWLRDDMRLRPTVETAGVDRKTVRRYVEAAQAAGLLRNGGEQQLTD